MKKIFLIILGCICLVFGAIGAFIPFLPSFPFLLISAFSFAKSNDKINNWFKSTRIYKNNLELYSNERKMTTQSKAKIIISITLVIGIAVFMMSKIPVGQLILAIVWLTHIVYFGFIVKPPSIKSIK